jgi:hypothetical protein
MAQNPEETVAKGQCPQAARQRVTLKVCTENEPEVNVRKPLGSVAPGTLWLNLKAQVNACEQSGSFRGPIEPAAPVNICGLLGSGAPCKHLSDLKPKRSMSAGFMAARPRARPVAKPVSA